MRINTVQLFTIRFPNYRNQLQRIISLLDLLAFRITHHHAYRNPQIEINRILCGEWGYVDNEVKSYVVHRCLVIVGYEGIHCTVNLILSKPISSKPKSSSKLITHSFIWCMWFYLVQELLRCICFSTLIPISITLFLISSTMQVQ